MRDNFGFRTSAGHDFAPGSLSTAFNYVDESAYTGPRHFPVIAMIKFTDLVRECGQGNVNVSSEGNWWRGSTEISPIADKSPERLLRLRRPPRSSQARLEILNAYKEHAIKIT